MTDNIILYTMPGSPYGRRVELVLEEKNIAYDMVPLSRSDGDLRTEEHLRRSPRGRVPVLVDGDVTLTESQAIVEYLEERFPTPALLPNDPARAPRCASKSSNACSISCPPWLRSRN